MMLPSALRPSTGFAPSFGLPRAASEGAFSRDRRNYGDEHLGRRSTSRPPLTYEVPIGEEQRPSDDEAAEMQNDGQPDASLIAYLSRLDKRDAERRAEAEGLRQLTTALQNEVAALKAEAKDMRQQLVEVAREGEELWQREVRARTDADYQLEQALRRSLGGDAAAAAAAFAAAAFEAGATAAVAVTEGERDAAAVNGRPSEPLVNACGRGLASRLRQSSPVAAGLASESPTRQRSPVSSPVAAGLTSESPTRQRSPVTLQRAPPESSSSTAQRVVSVNDAAPAPVSDPLNREAPSQDSPREVLECGGAQSLPSSSVDAPARAAPDLLTSTPATEHRGPLSPPCKAPPRFLSASIAGPLSARHTIGCARQSPPTPYTASTNSQPLGGSGRSGVPAKAAAQSFRQAHGASKGGSNSSSTNIGGSSSAVVPVATPRQQLKRPAPQPKPKASLCRPLQVPPAVPTPRTPR